MIREFKISDTEQVMKLWLSGNEDAHPFVQKEYWHMMGGRWEKFTPTLDDLPQKGDTVVGNDVWIGQNVT